MAFRRGHLSDQWPAGSQLAGAQNWKRAKEVHIVPKVIGISAIVGFFLSLAFLFAVSFYAVALRSALANCRDTQLNSQNQTVRCENKIGALRAEATALAARIESEKGNVRALESRLEAAGAPRRCAMDSWAVGQS